MDIFSSADHNWYLLVVRTNPASKLSVAILGLFDAEIMWPRFRLVKFTAQARSVRRDGNLFTRRKV
jgi:hypothetical protein